MGELGLHFDTVILIGVFLAFLFNIGFYLLKFTQNMSLLMTSSVMAASYFMSNHLFEIIITSGEPYLFWLTFDLLTIIILFFLHNILQCKASIAYLYTLLGLSINGLMFAGMHIDIGLLNNRNDWWFWTLYSVSINLFDLMMVVALIINRDFLFIVKGGRKIMKHFSCSEVQSN